MTSRYKLSWLMRFSEDPVGKFLAVIGLKKSRAGYQVG